MPVRLPIFPLSVVLFPGTPLPLHIFEPRYRRMLADCLQGDRRFGITPAGQDDAPPAAGTVGCVAEIRVNQELPDGRSNLIVLGGERFVLTRTLDDEAPYFVAMVQPFERPGRHRPAGRRDLRGCASCSSATTPCSASSTTSSPRSPPCPTIRSASRSTCPPRSSATPE